VPLVEQPHPMNAQRIMRKNAVLQNLVGAGHFHAFFVAPAARKGNVEFVHSRIGRLGSGDVVSAMTVPALGRESFSGFYCLAMETSGVDSCNLIMTYAAVDRLDIFLVRELSLG